MQISSRFSMALHVLLCVDVFAGTHKVTSDFVAASVHTNPVVIRKLMLQLRDAGLIQMAPGTGGISYRRPVADITMLDVYRAVDPDKDGHLFKMHPGAEAQCPVGGHIEKLLTPYFEAAQRALEDELARTSLRTLLDGLQGFREALVAGVASARS